MLASASKQQPAIGCSEGFTEEFPNQNTFVTKRLLTRVFENLALITYTVEIHPSASAGRTRSQRAT